MLSTDIIVEINVWNRGRENGNVAFSLDCVILEEIKDPLEPGEMCHFTLMLKSEK